MRSGGDSDSTKRKGILGAVMGLVVITLPIILGLLRLRGHDQTQEQLQKSIEQGHETRDMSVRAFILFCLGLAIMGVFALAVTTTLQVVSSKQGGISFQYPPLGLGNAPAPALPPEPRLEESPGQRLQELLKTQEDLLSSYGRTDETNGRVHIPIDRAIDLLLERGLPSRSQTGTQYEDTGDQIPSYPSSGRTMEKYP